VFDQRTPPDVCASLNAREICSYTKNSGTAAPGHALAELEEVVLDEIRRLVAHGPTADEMERGRIQAEAQFIYRLQTVGGFGGKSDQLNAYNVFLGDPSYFDRDLERYRVVTPDSMQAAVARYLDPSSRVTLSIVPRGRPELAAPDAETIAVS
jgi:zinc protease